MALAGPGVCPIDILGVFYFYRAAVEVNSLSLVYQLKKRSIEDIRRLFSRISSIEAGHLSLTIAEWAT